MFSERLREARKTAKLSQKQVANEVFVTQQTIGYYENGQVTPSPEMIKKLSKILGVSVSWLLEAEEASYSPDEIELISKYRELDERGQRAVRALIESL